MMYKTPGRLTLRRFGGVTTHTHAPSGAGDDPPRRDTKDRVHVALVRAPASLPEDVRGPSTVAPIRTDYYEKYCQCVVVNPQNDYSSVLDPESPRAAWAVGVGSGCCPSPLGVTRCDPPPRSTGTSLSLTPVPGSKGTWCTQRSLRTTTDSWGDGGLWCGGGIGHVWGRSVVVVSGSLGRWYM